MNKAAYLVVLVPLLWMAGIHAADFARLIAVASAAFALRLYVKGGLCALKNCTDLSQLWRPLQLVMALYFVSLLLILSINPYVGKLGLDHAIFSQVAYSWANFGNFDYSLVHPEIRNFLGDHLSPILIASGLLVQVGASPAAAVTIVHVLTLGAACAVLFRIFTHFGATQSVALFGTFLFALNPAVRHQVFFGAQIEFMAMPLVGLGYLMFLLKRHWLAVLALVLACSAKETMLVLCGFFGLMAVLDLKIRGEMTFRSSVPYALLMFFAVSVFAAYTFGHDYFFGRPYDYFNRLNEASPDRASVWFKKVWYSTFIFVPLLFVPLASRRGLILLIPAMGLLLLSMLSSFTNMYAPLSHYAVTPTYIGFVAAAAVLSSKEKLSSSRVPLWATLLLIGIAFSFASGKPHKSFRQFFSQPHLSAKQLSMVPSDAKVISSSSAAFFLFRTKHLVRIWTANRVDVEFDFIVTRPGEAAELSAELKSRSKVCHQTQLWQIRCAPGRELIWGKQADGA